MANLEEVAKLVQDTYANIWRGWYAEHPGCVPATVKVDLNCTSAGYGHKFNLIIISFADGNLDDYDILNSEAWPIWKTDLIHEMLHEYERKILTYPSSIVTLPTPGGSCRSSTMIEYLVFPNEGHRLIQPESRLKFFAATEQFLAKHLGGRAEPPSESDAWDELRR